MYTRKEKKLEKIKTSIIHLIKASDGKKTGPCKGRPPWPERPSKAVHDSDLAYIKEMYPDVYSKSWGDSCFLRMLDRKLEVDYNNTVLYLSQNSKYIESNSTRIDHINAALENMEANRKAILDEARKNQNNPKNQDNSKPKDQDNPKPKYEDYPDNYGDLD